MSHWGRTALVTVIAIGCLAPVPASGQDRAQGDADGASTWTLPRTPDGRPDLQGYWTTQTFTPLERPDYLAGNEVTVHFIDTGTTARPTVSWPHEQELAA